MDSPCFIILSLSVASGLVLSTLVNAFAVLLRYDDWLHNRTFITIFDSGARFQNNAFRRFDPTIIITTQKSCMLWNNWRLKHEWLVAATRFKEREVSNGCFAARCFVVLDFCYVLKLVFRIGIDCLVNVAAMMRVHGRWVLFGEKRRVFGRVPEFIIWPTCERSPRKKKVHSLSPPIE